MISRLCLLACIFSLASCVVKPPVQEMAEARSAVKVAQQLSSENQRSQSDKSSEFYLQSAEQTLQQAAEALEKKQYDRARNKAVKAKLQAQKAARLSQKNKTQ